MLPRGIQTKISLSLLGLLLTGMVLVDLVLLMVLQNQFIAFESNRAEGLLTHFQNYILENYKQEDFTHHELKELIKAQALFDESICFGAISDNSFYTVGNCTENQMLMQNMQLTIKTGRTKKRMIGSSWAVFQKAGSVIIETLPLKINEQTIGAAGLMFQLTPIYQRLRNSQNVFVFYLLVNATILSALGYYILSRIFMRPIKRLADRAEQYDAKLHDGDEDLLFTVRLEDGDFNKLSLALNQMMNRISKDKEKLLENVSALEHANLELKQAQKEVVRAEKLASVGRLSAGIAHEIGNPIGIILGYLELLKLKDQTVEERNDYLSRIEAEVFRINAIISQLLDISRPIQGKPVLFSIHAFLEDLIESVKLQPLLTDIQLKFNALADHDQINVDPEHLRQVILNLLINAADAVKSCKKAEDGIIQITTQVKRVFSGQHTQQIDMLEIRVSDNGSGISDVELGSIFDPFYTTKEPGKGTGLGLSVSLTIVEQMGGSLLVESKVANGTTMSILLPLIDK